MTDTEHLHARSTSVRTDDDHPENPLMIGSTLQDSTFGKEPEWEDMNTDFMEDSPGIFLKWWISEDPKKTWKCIPLLMSPRTFVLGIASTLVIMLTIFISVSIPIAYKMTKELDDEILVYTDSCHIFECGPRFLPNCSGTPGCILAPLRNCTILFRNSNIKIYSNLQDFGGTNDIPTNFFPCMSNYNGECGLFANSCPKIQRLHNEKNTIIVKTLVLNLFLLIVLFPSFVFLFSFLQRITMYQKVMSMKWDK